MQLFKFCVIDILNFIEDIYERLNVDINSARMNKCRQFIIVPGSIELESNFAVKAS